jgi:hypothetical protein
MADRDRRHLFVPDSAQAESYQRRRQKIPPIQYPHRNRREHGRLLRRELTAAAEEGHARRDAIAVHVEGAHPGLYFEFESFADSPVPLRVESLESTRAGIEVVMVREEEGVQRAVVFVPDGQLKYFLRRIEQYLEENTAKGEPKHKPLIESIGGVRLATLRALWTDEASLYPGPEESIWWEIWLRRTDGQELERLRAYAEQAGLTLRPQTVSFPDREVALGHGPVTALSGSLDVMNDIAELRRAKVAASEFLDLPPPQQAARAQELADRIVRAPANAPAVCLLDTGVNHGHPILAGSMSDADRHTYDPTWSIDDRNGHGTQMAGLALLGDLAQVLPTTGPVMLAHVLESVKVLPDDGSNPPDLYGHVTTESAARAEVGAPRRSRVFSLAVSAEDWRDRGRPSSWSAAIDQLAAGVGEVGGPKRLFFVSAGNLRGQPQANHLAASDTESIHDPGQAWNAITVGACTDRFNIVEPGLAEWTPLAQPGELSPSSTTSLTWEAQWPLKPEIVLEGGNWALSPNGQDTDCPESLSLLTTHHRPDQRAFAATGDTSAATAQAARIAANVRAAYPDWWDETIRALVVHSARWTRPMRERLEGATSKTARGQYLRRYGFGVPDERIALRSAANALTLVAQEEIRPFADGKMNEMHLHELPWPLEVLRELEDVKAQLRVTLSYFIEPNPGSRGWRRRHQYASHGLRFEVKTPTESVEEFRRRINQMAIDESGEKASTESDSADWLLGSVLRSKGSVHTDLWTGMAAELADRGYLAVYPVSGWWKEREGQTRTCRYALVVSIDVPEVDVDIYTPVAALIGVPVKILL